MTPNLYRPSIHRKKDGLLLVTCTGQGRFLTWLERLKLWLGLTDAERLERKFCRTPMTNGEDVLGEARKLSPDLSDWIDGQLRLGCSPENIIGVINAGTRLVKAEQELTKAHDEFRKAAP